MFYRSLPRNAATAVLGAVALIACGCSDADVTQDDETVEDDASFVDGARDSGSERDVPLPDDALQEVDEREEGSTDVVEVDAEPELDSGNADVSTPDSGDEDALSPDSGNTDPPPDPPPPVQGVTVGTLTETKLFNVNAPSGDHRVLQGGGSDGTHGYFVMMRILSGDIHITQLVKYAISSGKRVASASFNAPNKVTNKLGHGNDIAFNGDTNRLIIPAWTNDKSKQPTNNQRLLRIIDPATLKIVGTKTLDVSVTNLCYAKKTYLAFAGGMFRTYDGDFKLIKTIPFSIGAAEKKYAPGGKDGVSQGIDCDANYVYITRWYPKAESNVVYVTDWNAQLVGAYRYNGPESEHLMHISGNRMLHGFNTSASGDVRRIEKLMFVVKYDGEGGSGSMSNTRVLYGRKTLLRKNAFVRSGKSFAGWVAQRSSDGKWRYQKPGGSDDGWYAKGKQPSGWIHYVYKDGAIVLKTAPWGTVTMHAQWK